MPRLVRILVAAFAVVTALLVVGIFVSDFDLHVFMHRVSDRMRTERRAAANRKAWQASEGDVALEPAPTPLWRSDRPAGPPAIGPDGRIYISTPSALHALARDGARLWAYDGGAEWPRSEPPRPVLLPDGTIVVGRTGGLTALTREGVLRWQVDGTPGSVRRWSVPVVAGDLLYTTDGEFQLIAIGLDGDTRFTVDMKPYRITAFTAIAGGRVLYTAGGKLFAYDRDGRREWMYGTSDNVFERINVSPGGTVYLSGYAGRLTALNAAGQFRWQRAECATRDIVFESDESLLVMCLGRLTAYTHDGTQRWRIALDENAQYIKARSTVAPDGSVVAISGAIYSLGPDGGRRWTVQPWRPAPARSGSEEAPQPTAPTASPWIAPDGTIWVGCARSRLYGIARDGRVKWTYTLDESGEHPTVVDEAGGGWASAHGVNNDDGRERSVRGIIPNEDLLIVDANGLVVFRMPRE